MPSYHQLGQLPPKRHTKLRREVEESYLNEGIAYEHVVTTQGFDRAYSILYHLRPPTRTQHVGRIEAPPLIAADDQALRHHHFRTNHLPRRGNAVSGRVPLMFNTDLTCYRCRPADTQKTIYKNACADEVIYIHYGQGHVETLFGLLPYSECDYIVIPRGTLYRFVSSDTAEEDHLIIEAFGTVRVPDRYCNPDGQIQLGAPLYERDFGKPIELATIDDESPTDVIMKDRERLTRLTMPHNPLDVIGWDGHLYPYTFNALDFEPLTGTVHLPPPFQQTFEAPGFVICTFAPRTLDQHPDAIKVPYAHSNVDADEVLFYSRGHFGSRRGVDAASLTLHPGGIPHGPHPGTIRASETMTQTEELAVMFDTDRPLKLTREAMSLDDPQYPMTWLD